MSTLFICIGCRQNGKASSDTETPQVKKNFDWTGTYLLNDKDETYTLKLHRRNVDDSYEMLFYGNDKNEAIYKSSTYDAKDDSVHLCIRFMNNFHSDPSLIGFKSGDTLFVLHHIGEKNDTTYFKKFHPKSAGLNWKKISEAYN